MSSAISAALRRFVEERAHQRCEYCLLPMSVAFLRVHEVDHVIALKHGGATDEANLALACWRCNRHKGTDLTSFDPQTGELTRLFSPRTQVWREHFALESAVIIGQTAEGRTTVQLLRLATPERTAERQRLLSVGLYGLPPFEDPAP
jgi:hypothetical protein